MLVSAEEKLFWDDQILSYICRIKTLILRCNLKHWMCLWIVSFSECVKTADGGQILLDWFDNDNSKNYMDASTRPTILLLPGLTGTSKESYILHMIHLSEELGYRYWWKIFFLHFSLNSKRNTNYLPLFQKCLLFIAWIKQPPTLLFSLFLHSLFFLFFFSCFFFFQEDV